MSERSKELIDEACALYGADSFRTLVSDYQDDGLQIITHKWMGWEPTNDSTFNRVRGLMEDIVPIDLRSEVDDMCRGGIIWYWNYVSALWALAICRDGVLDKTYTNRMLELKAYGSGTVTQICHIMAHKGLDEAEGFVRRRLAFDINRDAALKLIDGIREDLEVPDD